MQQIKIVTTGAYPYLALDDGQFVRQCRVEAYVASGPGGQKRNRTYSAVRAVHLPTGIISIAEESRSQLENKRRALQRLKKTIAIVIRAQSPQQTGSQHPEAAELLQPANTSRINPKNPAYPLLCAIILDSLLFAEGRISAAAASLKVSTGRLNSFLMRDRELLTAANRVRQHFALKPLKIA
jgi:hypothetical protein